MDDTSSGEGGRVAAQGEREIEFKLGISDEADFRAVMAAAGGRVLALVEQTNRFFDTASGALARARISCRLRRERKAVGDETYTLTLKGPSRSSVSDEFCSDRAELNRRLDREAAARVLAGERSPLQLMAQAGVLGDTQALLMGTAREACSGEPLVEVGAFVNLRTAVETRLEDGARTLPVLLEFDRSVFPGNDVQYEVECELQQPDDASEAADLRASHWRALEALFARAEVSPHPVASKLSRFRAALARSDG